MEEFSAAVAREVSGASQRQLDYWDELEIVPAAITRKKGKGTERRYSDTDLLKLRVVVELRRAGVSLQRVRKAVTLLNRYDPSSDALANKTFIIDGGDILVTTPDPQVLKSLLNRGQLAFSGIFLGKVIEQTSRSIKLYNKRKATA
jgi:DNA-binding transcriptional MerR regulator